MPVLARKLIPLALLVTLPTLACKAAEPPDRAIARVGVYPGRIQFGSPRDRAQLVVTAYYEGGSTRDVTRIADFTSSDEGVAAVDRGVASPRRDGEASIDVTFAGRAVRVPVIVSGQAVPDPIRFRYETLAVLTKQGCNAGSCHGSPQGKGGFSLSLFAYDPRSDERSLVRDAFNRRVNVFDPDESLLLKKPMLRVPHVGGKRIRNTDVAYGILRDWIFEGAHGDAAEASECRQITVHPGPERVLRAPHLDQQLSVMAHFADGTARDVTHLATYDTSHDERATVTADGLVTGHQRGHAAVTVRYLEHLESVYFTVVRDVAGFEWVDVPERNFIDALVNDRLKLLQFTAAPTASDSVFLRRVYLDLTGLLPDHEAAARFLADRAVDKRRRVIAELLESREFARFQALRLADLLRVQPELLAEDRAERFAAWIVDAVAENVPFDELAERLLTASGDTQSVVEANFYAALGGSEAIAEATAQIFMGSRVQCAKCHNHPFENWTQDDYYRIAAVFARVRKDGGVITMAAEGEMTNPSTGQVMRPWGAAESEVPSEANTPPDFRHEFAAWLTARDNPFFARVEVNRIWHHMFGRGIVEPIDDFRSSNPPVNAPLLDALADEFVRSGYDRRHLFRLIAESQTYQRATAANPSNELDESLFSHARVRRLSAEQLNDAIGYVTGALPTAADFAAQIRSDRTKLEARTADLQSNLSAWETEQRQRLAAVPYRHGGWWSIGPFAATDPKASHDEAFLPEQNLEAVEPSEPFANGLLWRPEPAFVPGQRIVLASPPPSATYVLHEMSVDLPGQARLTLAADDGLKVWHNGAIVFDQRQLPGPPATRDVEFALAEGRNQLLLKVSNRTGQSDFTLRFEYLGDEADVLRELPADVIAILGDKDASRTPAERDAVLTCCLQNDDSIRTLQQRMARGHFAFATQRPYPERTRFLTAFGQPERQTACACERSNEPTLDQALQLLNGESVHGRVEQSVAAYESIPTAELVTRLYFSAFSRPPKDVERRAAVEYLARGQDRAAAIRDLVWAVLNTQEFMFQH